MVIKMKELLFSIFMILIASVASASIFYCDPINGSMANDGSQAHPWTTIEDVWNSGKIQTTYTAGGVLYNKNTSGPVKPGDTIYLLSGFHGTLSVTGARNTDWIYVKAAPGATPYLHKIYALGVGKWWFEGLKVTPSADPAYIVGTRSTLINIDSNNWYGWSTDVTIKNSSLYTVADAGEWDTIDEWSAYPYNGIISKAQYTIIDGCTLRNVGQGIRFSDNEYPSHYSTIRLTTIDHASQDPIWVFYSDHVTVEKNTIKNVVGVLDRTIYHYDMLQSVASDFLTIRNNLFVANEPGAMPDALIANCQGVGMFDGWYDSAVIENNIVSVNSYHGISIYGATNSRMINNTVVYNQYSYWAGGPSSAQIGIFDHKTAGSGSNNVMRNNICTSIRSVSTGTIADHNSAVVPSDYANHFLSANSLVYTLIALATEVNAGSSDLAPLTDYLENTRDAHPDVGAYEYGALAAGRKFFPFKTNGKATRAPQ